MLSCVIHADASGYLCLFPSIAALADSSLCSQFRDKTVALFWCLGIPASEEALLGRSGEECVAGIHKSFLELMENCGSQPPAAEVRVPEGLWPGDLQRTVVRACPHAATKEAFSLLWGIPELFREGASEHGWGAHVWRVEAVWPQATEQGLPRTKGTAGQPGSKRVQGVASKNGAGPSEQGLQSNTK